MSAVDQIGAEAERFLATYGSDYSIRIDPTVYPTVYVFYQGKLIAKEDFMWREGRISRWVRKTVRRHRKFMDELAREGVRYTP